MLSSVWRKDEKHREEIKRQHYLFHKDYYYVASLIQRREFNYYNDILTIGNRVVVTYFSSFSDLPQFKGDKIYTNVLTNNKLWKIVKQKYPSLCHRYNENLNFAYQDLAGLKENKSIVIDESALRQIRIGIKLYADENKYTPSLEALMQLSLTI